MGPVTAAAVVIREKAPEATLAGPLAEVEAGRVVRAASGALEAAQAATAAAR